MVKTLRLCMIIFLFTGLIYPLLMTGVSQLLFPKQADGSLLRNESGEVVGSKLIGQSFSDPKYFMGRVSSIGYNAAGSGSNNFGPSNPALIERVKTDIANFLAANPTVRQEDIPADLLTNSASGLDPHISPMAANIQVDRIATVRGIDPAVIKSEINKYTEGRFLGVFGDPAVNVLRLNMALDQLK